MNTHKHDTSSQMSTGSTARGGAARRRRISLLCAALALLLLLRPALAGWTLTTADDTTGVPVTVNTLSAADGLSCSTDDGKLHQVPMRNLVLLQSARSAAGSPMPWQLRLRNQDVLFGTPVALKGAALEFQTQELGTIAVPLRLVAALVSRDAAAQAVVAAPDHDTLRLQNGDRLDGVLTALADGKATIQSDLGETPIDLARVSQLVLGGVTPARGIPPLAFRVTLLSGTVLTTPRLTWTINSATLQDPAEAEHTCPTDQIVAVEVLGGRHVRLTELDPAQEEHTSYLNTPWPAQLDRNVLGGPLRIDGQTFGRGVGVHTSSTLAYQLDGSFTTLRLVAGLDDTAAPYGRANLAVLLDGQLAWEQKNVAPGSGIPLTLDLKHAQRLELRATSPTGLDILGRVDWIDPVLARP